MKILLAILLLVLSACSKEVKLDEVQKFECYGVSTSEGEILEEYYLLYADPNKDDYVLRSEAIYNWIYGEELDMIGLRQYEQTQTKLFEDVKGVVYEINNQPYLVQEKVMYDYTRTDFQQMVDKELLEQTNFQTPTYISMEMSLQGYRDLGLECQELTDTTTSYKETMMYPDFGVEATTPHENAPKPTTSQPTDTPVASGEDATLICTTVNAEHPELVSTQTYLFNEASDLVKKQTVHLERHIPADADHAYIETTLRNNGTAYNALNGVTYTYVILDTHTEEDFILDFETADFQQLVDAGLLELANGKAPTFISYQLTLQSFEGSTYDCVTQ